MKSRRDVLIFAIGLPMMLASWLAFNYFSRDELDVQLRALAGKSAVDCGAMTRGVNDASATASVQNCAIESFKKNQPFFYRATLTPIPNQPLQSVGTVVTPKKEMFLISAEEPTWENWLGRVMGKAQCYNPRLAAADNGTLTITFDRAPKAKKKPSAAAPSTPLEETAPKASSSNTPSPKAPSPKAPAPKAPAPTSSTRSDEKRS